MANPADALHAILEPWIGDTSRQIFALRGTGKNGPDSNMKLHRQAIALINEIERLLHSTQRRERAIEADTKYLESLTKIVFAYPHNWQSQPIASSPNLSDPGILDYLTSIAERLEDLVPETGPEERQGIADFLTELTSLMVDDHSLPAQLRQHMRRLIVEAETCLSEYEIMGDFALQASLDRIAVAIMQASKQSSQSKKWEAFMAKLVYPSAAGFIGSVPMGAIALATGAS